MKFEEITRGGFPEFQIYHYVFLGSVNMTTGNIFIH